MFLNSKNFLFTFIALFGSLPAYANLCDGRSQTVAVALQDATSKTCEQIVPEDLEKITELEVWSETDPDTYTEVLPGDFKGLTGLTNLTILGAFTTIPSNAFSDLKDLSELVIEDSLLTTLPDGLFSHLHLKKLDLLGTDVSDLPQTIFSHLYRLQELQLPASDGFTALLFKDLIRLKSLTLSTPEGEEEIAKASMPIDTFQYLESLEELTTYSVIIPTLPRINHLKNLRSVDFSEMDLTSLPPDFFTGLEALTLVSLSSNELTAFPVGFFATNKNLTSVDLSDNSFSPEEEARLKSEYPNVKIRF